MRLKILKIILIISLLASNAGLPSLASEEEHALRPLAFSLSSLGSSEPSFKSSPAGKRGPACHKYEALSRRESKKVVISILKKHNLQDLAFYDAMIGSVKASEPMLKLGFISLSGLKPSVLDNLEFNRIVHCGILRDEEGVLWVVKKYLSNAQEAYIEQRSEKNFRRREMLAYLLTRTAANSAEIRFLTMEEAEGVPILKNDLDNLRDYYLVRAGYGNNIPLEGLASNEKKRAYSANFVASVLMRKWDSHRANMTFTGDIPVMIDNDECFRYDYFPHGKCSNKFAYLYLSSLLLAPVNRLVDKLCVSSDLGYDEHIANHAYLEDIILLEQMYNVNLDLIQEARNDLHFEGAFTVISSMFKDFGIGEGFLDYMNLDLRHIKAAIRKFKRIKNIRAMAKQAGYSEDDLASVVKFIKACQSTLGEDVNRILEIVTGADYGLDSLDREGKASPKSSAAGKKAPGWPEKVWDAVNELGIEKAKLMIYPHFAEYLSGKLGIDVMFLDTIQLAHKGILHKLNQNVMSILREDGYQELLNDPEVGKDKLEVCGIHGPGVCIMEDVFLSFSLPNNMAPHTYSFHEFCEYLAVEENDIDYTLIHFHGHCSFRVLVETFKFADKIGELRVLLGDWRTHFEMVISERGHRYPAILYKEYTRLLELAESRQMFRHSTNEALTMLDEAAKAPAQAIPVESIQSASISTQKVQFDINSAVSSAA